MRNFTLVSSAILATFSFMQFGNAQVSTGFFNDAVFNTYTNINAGSLSGNNFTVSYSGTFNTREVSSFTPGNMPANTGYPSTNPSLLNLRGDAVNNYTQYSFTNNLPQFSTLFVEDVDYVGSGNESVRIEFFDAGSNLINTSNIIIKTISTTGLPVVTTAATSVTVTGNGASSTEPLITLTITSTNVRTVRITQLTTTGAGSYAVFFAVLRTDHGDAPVGYGDAMHFPSTTLRLGTVGPDAEATAQVTPQADGDNNAASATVINDEDGIANFPTLSNTATSYSVNATVFNSTGANATLLGWIDFDRNGVFDPGEASSPVTVANGATSATVTWTPLNGLVVGSTYARFRIASNSSEANTPAGVAFIGEVEDYTVEITAVAPLSFINLSASRSGNNIITTWKTASESNVSHFVVEYSTDASNFLNSGSVPASNGAENNYKFILQNLIDPVYYIRIRSVDNDGTIKYSSTVTVKNTNSHTKTISVSPNPVVNNIDLGVMSGTATDCDIRILNAAGRVVYRSKANLSKGENRIYINGLSSQPRGTYVVQVIMGSEQMTKKIILAY